MTCHCEQFSSQKGSWQKSRRHHRPYHHHHHHPNGILPQCRWYAVNGNGYSRNRAIAFISNGQWVIGRPGIIDCRCQLWLLHNLMWHILFLLLLHFCMNQYHWVTIVPHLIDVKTHAICNAHCRQFRRYYQPQSCQIWRDRTIFMLELICWTSTGTFRIMHKPLFIGQLLWIRWWKVSTCPIMAQSCPMSILNGKLKRNQKSRHNYWWRWRLEGRDRPRNLSSLV